MNIDLKLKDCTLVEMKSELGTALNYDYYGTSERATENITFIFDDESCADFCDIDEYYGTFCYLANFFYKKEFSQYTKDEFLKEFSEYVNTKFKIREEDI